MTDSPAARFDWSLTEKKGRFWVWRGALDRASPNFMGLASFGLEIGVFCDFLDRVLLLSVILGLYFLGLALSWPQARRRAEAAELARDFEVSRGRVCH